MFIFTNYPQNKYLMKKRSWYLKIDKKLGGARRG